MKVVLVFTIDDGDSYRFWVHIAPIFSRKINLRASTLGNNGQYGSSLQGTLMKLCDVAMLETTALDCFAW